MRNTGAKNSAGRVVYRGIKGGLFVVLPSGNKKYITTRAGRGAGANNAPPAPPANQGSAIHRGPKGGLYVLLPGGTKKYVTPPTPAAPHPASTPDIRTRTQQGGTCWFHAIVNGLLMSPRPRRLLSEMVANVPSANFGAAACPSKTANRAWFLAYIKHRLQGPGPVHDVFKNADVIRAAGFRRVQPAAAAPVYFVKKGTDVDGGTSADMKWFYEKMFPPGLFVIEQFEGPKKQGNPGVPHSKVQDGAEYELTHAWIRYSFYRQIGTKGNNHAIAGYKTARGAFIGYDSFDDAEVPAYDWTKPTKRGWPAKAMTIRRYKAVKRIGIHAVYMRKGA